MTPAAKSHLEESLALQLSALKVPAPEREYKFLVTRRFRFDFAWPICKLAAEVEGGIYTKGRHTRGEGFERDAEKYNLAALAGWRVLRFTRKAIKDGSAALTIGNALREVRA